MLTLDKIEAAHFESYLGQPFPAHAGEYSGTWDLFEVTLLGSPRMEASSASPATPRRSFSAVFKAPAEARLSQGIYTITHPALGALDIFLVPIRADKDGYYLEAVFN